MKKDLTEMVFILDRSGSMYPLVADTIGGFNSMIENQKKDPGEAYVTTILFDDEYEKLHDHVNIREIKSITDKDYYTRGCTALFDAIGKTINSIGARLNDTPEEERPGKVIFVITTDGEENASLEFTRTKVREMIEHQQTKYSWTFMFLGANIDAETEAESLGINKNFSKKYTASSIGTQTLYASVSKAMTVVRDCKTNLSTDANACIAITAALDEIQ